MGQYPLDVICPGCNTKQVATLDGFIAWHRDCDCRRVELAPTQPPSGARRERGPYQPPRKRLVKRPKAVEDSE